MQLVGPEMAGELTTDEVLAACQSVGLTRPRLARYKRAGLIAPPARKGRGKGGGRGSKSREWAMDTPARAILASRVLQDDEAQGHKPSLRRAAHILVGAGYSVQADVLRDLMIDHLSETERAVWKYRGNFRDLPKREVRSRLDESIERRYANWQPDGVQLLKHAQSGLAGVADGAGMFGLVSQCLAVESRRAAVQSAADESLLQILQETADVLRDPSASAVLIEVMTALGLLVGANGEAVITMLGAPARAIGADAAKVSIDDCEQSAAMTLWLSTCWLIGKEVVAGRIARTILGSVMSNTPSEDPGVVFGRMVREAMDHVVGTAEESRAVVQEAANGRSNENC